MLRHKGKRQQPTETHGKLGWADRLPSVQKMSVLGKHLDIRNWILAVFRREKSKGCVAMLIELKTRLYTANQMPHRTALSMEVAFGVATAQYPTGAFQPRLLTRTRSVSLFKSGSHT
ncbi:IS30 family transposase [Paenibacillus sp. PvR133]|uniref:hypothetical protein n=1 Tax=Paenibacillus sp. PvR133 TaxID=2806598 RepID=UPI001AE47AFF|nr:hypothetical protein [Paenibacillus sp. PvR133]MBP1177634.1 IS30 family transposase [Paenibacillus sp. PvR133]